MSNDNGKSPEVKIQKVDVMCEQVLQQQNRLVFTTANGHYLGSLTFDAKDPEALVIMARQFANIAAAQAGRVQVATPAGLAAGALKI